MVLYTVIYASRKLQEFRVEQLMSKVNVTVVIKKDGETIYESFDVDSSITGIRMNQKFQDNMKRISEKYKTDKLEFSAFKEDSIFKSNKV